MIVAKPTNNSCYIVRSLPGLCFAMIYGALLTKTNRIARILAQDKKRIMTRSVFRKGKMLIQIINFFSSQPRFLSTSAQVVITWILVGVELSIVIALLMVYAPEAHKERIPPLSGLWF